MDYENEVKKLENLVYKMAELLHSLDNSLCDLIPDEQKCDGNCIDCISRYFEVN